ncbi:MAG: hypothetical protein ACI9EW_003786 [Cellvibrionaceae bacterium]|jgi:hypothetical protein
MSESQTIACTLPIGEINKRKEFELKDLFAGTLETRELPNGYELQFPSDETWFNNLTAFIANERQCCAFLHFELIVLPNHAPISMRILGSAEVKEFIRGFLMTPVAN